MLLDSGTLLVQLLNSLQFSMLLFLLSVGLTVIFGLMNFVNLAHGSFYAIGSLVAYSVAGWLENVWLSYLIAPLAVVGLGLFLYSAVINRMRTEGPLAQVLVTFGLIFVLIDVQRMVWGTDQLGITQTIPFAGSFELVGQVYPSYRIFIIAVGIAIYALLYFLLERTRLGAEVRACVDDPETASCLGINVERTFIATFLIGCGLAGLAGAVMLPAFSAEAGMGTAILVPTMAVIVVGGLGSLTGALVGSLLIGTTITFGQVLTPSFSGVLMYALLILVLLFRPQGLMPVRS